MNELDKLIGRFSGYSDHYKLYGGKVELVFDKNNHEYLLVQNGELKKIPSVTTICHKTVNKTEILIPWGCKMMGEKLLSLFPSNSNFITQSELQNLIRQSKDAHREKLDEAGLVGNMAHNWIENHIKLQLQGDTVGMAMPVDERANSACVAALNWMKLHNVRWICTETKIYSDIHKYAGTMDGLAITDSCNDRICCPIEFKDRKSIIDWKTSNNLYLDYLFQEAAYRGAYLEEHPDEIIEDGWVIRLGKDDASFNPWHIWDADEFEMYYYGFLNARKWYSSMEYAEEQVDIKNERILSLREAEKERIKQEQYKVKCKSADKYKGVRYPVCNEGHPCETCLKKYTEKHLTKEVVSDTLV